MIYDSQDKCIIANISRLTVLFVYFLQENPTDETVFQQTQEPSGFETFASNRHYIPLKLNKRKPLFLSMRKTGHMKNGIKTTRNHRTTLLSVIPARDTF